MLTAWDVDAYLVVCGALARLVAHGTPVAEYCFDSVEIRHPPGEPDPIRPDKPERAQEVVSNGRSRLTGSVSLQRTPRSCRNTAFSSSIPERTDLRSR
ncbi:hypothetical protein LX86_008237 [Lentzea aerocolonigenes]|nr:hypothetical protein [Lentzea aerocolonigenes]